MSETDGWLENELEVVAACPACSAPRPAVCAYSHVKDFWEGVAGEWSFRQCHRCNCLFLDPRPSRLALSKAYRRYYTHTAHPPAGGGENGSGLGWALVNGYLNAHYGSDRSPAIGLGRVVVPLMPCRRLQFDYFYRHLPATKGRLLDVGCGNGAYLRRARDAGWHCLGLDPDQVAAGKARAEGIDVHVGTIDDLPFSDGFDYITVAHVIEHVHDLKVFVSLLMAHLKPGGCVWVATPNIKGTGLARYGRFWRGLEAPRHLTLISPHSLINLFTTAGFIDTRLQRRGRGAAFILQKSQEYAASVAPCSKVSTWWVDLCATFSSLRGEEIVLTARKPLVHSDLTGQSRRESCGNEVNRRQAHAVMDIASRHLKGQKIERLLGLERLSGSAVRLLEVGTGSGGIAHFFANHANALFDVHAVDTTNSLMVHEGFRFTQVASTALPFEGNSFDVVLSNHVIEHVGDAEAQLHHLREIHRVVSTEGKVYLAVPNRWMLVEPHFGIAFLSWLPRMLRTPYLRLRRGGTFYDCEPLQKREVESLATRAGFSATNISVLALRQTLAIEGDKGLLARVASIFPDALLRRLEGIIPTHIYLLRPLSSGSFSGSTAQASVPRYDLPVTGESN